MRHPLTALTGFPLLIAIATAAAAGEPAVSPRLAK